MSREETARRAPSGEIAENSLRTERLDVRVAITAYRGGDMFLFDGHLSEITGNGIAVTVIGNLTVGEWVRLQHSINSVTPLQQYARVSLHRGEKYDLEFLLLSDCQIRALTETCDWSLAADLA